MHTDTITTIAVDHSKSLQDMIAAGTYDWVNNNIPPRRFPIAGTGIVKFEPKLFHFDREISSEDVVKAIIADDRKNPWEPAKIEHLLAYGATFPEHQRQHPIVGLGSVAEVDSDRRVPCLDRDGAERDLYLYWWDRGWDGRYRFLAVRTLSSAA
jgi:hypothetical protein